MRDLVTSREADDISNLTFIGGKTNRAISDKPPATYLPPLIAQLGQPMFDAQAIPVDAGGYCFESLSLAGPTYGSIGPFGLGNHPAGKAIVDGRASN